MAEYKSVVVWNREGAVFTDNRYSRGHRWLFDGGVEVPASSSPHVVPLPLSVAEAVDPEEALVAATIYAAASLDRAHVIGSLEPGKLMDAVVVNGDLVDLLRVGAPSIRLVIKRGRAVAGW